MRPIEDLKDCGTDPLVVALTGDGKREKKILHALAQRYDGHNKALLLPTKAPPIGAERRRIGRFSGLSAFQVVRTYVSNWRFSEYLLILDIEHLRDNRTPESLQRDIQASLSNFGFTELDITRLNDRAFRVRCMLGPHRIHMNVVLSGSNKCIEENISELLRLEHNLHVGMDKHAIHDALRGLNLSLHDLLTHCNAGNLSSAFSGLVDALRDFENQNTT